MDNNVQRLIQCKKEKQNIYDDILEKIFVHKTATILKMLGYFSVSQSMMTNYDKELYIELVTAKEYIVHCLKLIDEVKSNKCSKNDINLINKIQYELQSVLIEKASLMQSYTINPIEEERNKIIDYNAGQLLDMLSDVRSEYIEKYYCELLLGNKNIIKTINDSINEKYIQKMCSATISVINSSVLMLNNNKDRVVLNEYIQLFEYLVGAYENINNEIKNTKGISIAIEEVIGYCSFCYNHINNKLMSINRSRSLYTYKKYEIDVDVFGKKIDESIKSVADEFFVGLEIMGLDKSYEDCINIIVEKYKYNFMTEEQKIVDVVDNIINKFNEFLNVYYSDFENLKTLDNYKVVEAIANTVKIKVENIVEQKDGLKIVEVTCKEDIVNLIEADKIDDILNNTTCDNNVSIEYKQFVVECLLNEIITLDEIYCYSIQNIKNETDVYTKKYVNAFEKMIDDIENELVKINISKINPKEHDLFDARKHNVLIAEDNKQFKKGEVIKTVNVGYEQGEKVLVRATIVASK